MKNIEFKKRYLADLSVETHEKIEDKSFDEAGEHAAIRRDVVVESLGGMLPKKALFKVTSKIEILLSSSGEQHALVSISYAGIYELTHCPHNDAEYLLNVVCPQYLEPDILQAVNEMLLRMTFPPLMLQPFDFESRLEEKKARGA